MAGVSDCNARPGLANHVLGVGAVAEDRERVPEDLRRMTAVEVVEGPRGAGTLLWRRHHPNGVCARGFPQPPNCLFTTTARKFRAPQTSSLCTRYKLLPHPDSNEVEGGLVR